MGVKDRIPSENELSQIIGRHKSSVTEEIKRAVGHLEAEYRKMRRHQLIGWCLVVFAIALPQGFFALLDFTSLPGFYQESGSLFMWLVVVLSAIAGGKLVITGNEVIRNFHTGVNRILFKKAFELLGLTGTLHEDLIPPSPTTNRVESLLKSLVPAVTPEDLKALQLLDTSELITEPHNRNTVDDTFFATVDGRSIDGAEIDIKQESGSGKNRSVKDIFRGYLISYELNKQLEGKTFVSTEGDKSGFGHQSFFANKKGNIRETKLEWNEFEKLLHVATDNEVEARYILTTDFMSDLYLWWQEKKENIRISFIGNRMYVLFPDNKIKFSDTIPKIDEDEVSKYLFTIAKPLMHVVHLIEDVRL